MGKPTWYGKEIVKALRCISTEGNVAPDCKGCPFYAKEQLDPEWAAKVGTDELYGCDCNAVGFAAADLIENQQNHIRALLQANDALRPAWIPVTERLPEEHDSIFAKAYGTKRWADGMFRTISDEVLVCVAFDDGRKTTMTLRTHDGAWALSSVHRGHVTHWMPLPPAPEVD